MREKLIRNSLFTSFDGAVNIHTDHQRPDRFRHIEMSFDNQFRIARGGGYSFSAASFGEKKLVQEMSFFNRFIKFDPDHKAITVEAGMSIGQLVSWVMKHNLYFPVLPGYPEITVGGCVAADVHGKNPWKDGTFSDWVLEMKLFHPSFGYLKLTRDFNAEIFALTCGGFGLTGLIVEIKLQLVDLTSNGFEVKKTPVASLTEATSKLTELSDQSDFIYSFHDGTGRGASFGQGIVLSGRWLLDKKMNMKAKVQSKIMTAQSRAKIPFSIWNRYTVGLGTKLFLSMNKMNLSQTIDVNKATFPFAYNTLYHRFFGRKGLAEVQVLVGNKTVELFIQKLNELVNVQNPPLVMMSMKKFKGKQTSLSMSGSGFLIALNFYRDKNLSTFFESLDNLLIETSAQSNLSKDSRVSSSVITKTLPNYSSFNSRLSLFDPLRLYRSELSDRIGI
ncbi:MAG: FAD-binding oxidoreductase [Pseudobdellovibrio sp.]